MAFIGAIRSLVARSDILEGTDDSRRDALLSKDPSVDQRKLHISLIHSERTPDFPFLNELLDILQKFGGDSSPHFHFSFAFCYTGRSEEAKARLQKLHASHPLWKLHFARVSQSLLKSAIGEFASPSETPIYGCGPGKFQKSVRENLLKSIGHPRDKIHLEYFDL